MINSIHNKVFNQISKIKKGKIIFPSDFKEIASSEAIRKTLSRLTKDGTLVRLAHGIYISPKRDPLLGIIYPSTDEITKAIAKRDKLRIMPSGPSALNKLGLSTQVPMNAVYITDGKPKTIKAGKRTIIFKTAAPKKFSAKGYISGLTIQALEEIGKNNINQKIMNRIAEVLSQEDKTLIHEDAKIAPEWIAKILISNTKK